MSAQLTRDDYIRLAENFLNESDTQGDVLSLLTEEVVFTFPKWGTAHGKVELVRFFQDMARHIAALRHPAGHRRFIVDGPRVCVQGVTEGSLRNGTTWHSIPFSTVYEFEGNLIKRVEIYTDPDMTDETRHHYPWLR